MDTSNSNSGRVRVMWQLRLQSALRSALAFAIVGAITIYTPDFVARRLKFPAFSYLTAVIILSDAALGDALRGCWDSVVATVQVVPVAMVARWWFGEGRSLSISGAAAAVGLMTFVVALPEWTHVTAKRIAFGQIVLVCTEAVLTEDPSAGFMHPVCVAASTALGALASALALMVPYPDLACNKIQKLCRVYANNTSQRMDLYLTTLGIPGSRAKKELLSQARPLAETGTKLLQTITTLHEGAWWEKPWRRYSKASIDRLERTEVYLRGIEHSLESVSNIPVEEVDQEILTSVLKGVSAQVQQKIEQIRCYSPFQSVNEAEMTKGERLSLPLKPFRPLLKYRWILFYFSCIDMLLCNTEDNYTAHQGQSEKPGSTPIKRAVKSWVWKIISKEKIEFALKCSLSLGLAVLFGMIFNKKQGRWAGLTIAISIVTGKQAVFTVANTRAQGTAIGSIYGVICCFLFHYEVLKLLAIIPWVIFSSLLKSSKMYGQSGGISAAIGALLILGRKNYGPPNDFAIARVTEVFIGLTTFVVVELCLQPKRAAEIAKNQLCTTLNSLSDCLKQTRSFLSQGNQTITTLHELNEIQRNVAHQVRELKKAVAEAELEPNFWYIPFRTSCYHNLAQSLTKISDLLHLAIRNLAIVQELSENGNVIEEFYRQIHDNLELCQEHISSSEEHLQKAQPINGQEDSPWQEDPQLRDLENGKLQNQETRSNSIAEQASVERANVDETEDDKELKERAVQHIGATAFCFNILINEIDEIQMRIREIN